MNLVDKIEKAYLRKGLPDFRAGDTIRVYAKIKEGERERLQAFEGIVLRLRGSGSKETVTVRKISYGVGVERIFPLHSPVIDKIEVVQKGKVRRARLYYLRKLSGRAANVENRESYESGDSGDASQTSKEEYKFQGGQTEISQHTTASH